MLVTGSWKLETGNWKLETGKDVSAPASSLRPDSGQGFQPPAASFQLLASNAVTRLLAAAIVRLGEVDLALTGELGATDGTGGLAPRLAAALGWPVTLDAVGLSQNEDGLWAVVGPADARFVPIVQPAVVAIVPGPERPRYPHPRRIANAWNEGLVEFLTPADLGLTPDALTPDTEPGSLILGPERVRGQVVGGAIGEAAKTVVGMLRAKRVI
jgi:electron transfer flavoprotein beta subunit